MPNSLNAFGRLLIIAGLLLIIIGIFLKWGGKIPWLGRLPGDILIRRGNFTFYFPLATCIIVSIILSLIFALFSRR
jgi:hypothetical protein